LLPRLLPGEKPGADAGYVDPHFLTRFSTSGATQRMLEINQGLKIIAARHESVHSRFLNFECLNV